MSSGIIFEGFRPDLEHAARKQCEHRAKEVYVFASIVEPLEQIKPSGLDIAVSELPPDSFLHADGILLGKPEHRFSLIDLDEGTRFAGRLREPEKLERVA